MDCSNTGRSFGYRGKGRSGASLWSGPGVYERAWRKPREFDPTSEKPTGLEFNPRYTPEQPELIEATFLLMLDPPKP
jgi:hypothetical protein